MFPVMWPYHFLFPFLWGEVQLVRGGKESTNSILKLWGVADLAAKAASNHSSSQTICDGFSCDIATSSELSTLIYMHKRRTTYEGLSAPYVFN